MRSLFGRIWLSYALVIALTLGTALAVSFALAVKRAQDTSRLSAPTLARAAEAELRKGGREGLGQWIMAQRHTHPELELYFVDQNGQELFSRALAGRPLPGAESAAPPLVGAPGAGPFRFYLRRTRDFAFGPWQLAFQPALLLGLAVVVSALGSAALARQLAYPVEHLRRSVRAIAAGAVDSQMSPDIAGRTDEVGGLARDIDQMTAHLRALIASKEHLLRDISHELRSPLARLRVAVRLQESQTAEGRVEATRRIDREVERLDHLIGQILNYSRVQSKPVLNSEPFDLISVLEEIAEDARLEGCPDGKHVQVTGVKSLTIMGDRFLIASALENIVRNGLRFSPPGQTITINAERAGREARVTVADRGAGMDREALSRIGEPFFRAAGSNGVGLGLSIAHGIAAMHGGHVSAHNQNGGGLAVDFLILRTPPQDGRPGATMGHPA